MCEKNLSPFVMLDTFVNLLDTFLINYMWKVFLFCHKKEKNYKEHQRESLSVF